MASSAARQPLLLVGQSSLSTAEAFPRLIHPCLTNTSSVDPMLPNEPMILPCDQSYNKENFAAGLKNQKIFSSLKRLVDPISVKKVEYYNSIPKVS